MFYCRVPIFIDQIRETLICILEKWQTIPSESDDDTSSDDKAQSNDKMNEIAQCLTPEVYIGYSKHHTIAEISSYLKV